MIRIFFFLASRISTYLIITLLIMGSAFFYRTIRARRQSELVEIVFSRGGNCWYDYQVDSKCLSKEGKQVSDYQWFEQFVGRDFFSSVYRVDLNRVQKFDFDLRWFPNVRRVENLGKIHDGNLGLIPSTQFISSVGKDVGIVFPFRNLRNLRSLHFDQTWRDHSDLTWIERLKKLESLTINVDRPERLKRLRKHPGLKSIQIYASKDSASLDCRDLKTIPRLEEVRIESSQFPNIKSLVDHPKLTKIHIDTDRFVIPFEMEVPQVRSISVADSGHQNFHDLRQFPNLVELRISNSVAYNLQEINHLFKLRKLKLPNSFFPRSFSLSNLKNLESLGVENLKGIRLQDLPNPDHLSVLRVHQSEKIQLPKFTKNSKLVEMVLNCSGRISGMPKTLPMLKSLRVYNARFRHVPQSENLESIRCRYCTVREANAFNRFPKLQSFDFERGRIESLALLKDSYLLQTLSIKDTPVSSLANLKGLCSIKYLSLAGTQVKDLSPLKDSRSIVQMDLSRTLFQDLKQLKMFPNLELLILEKSQGVVDCNELIRNTDCSTFVFSASKVRNLGALTGKGNRYRVEIVVEEGDQAVLKEHLKHSASIEISIRCNPIQLDRRMFRWVYAIRQWKVFLDYFGRISYGQIQWQPAFYDRLKTQAKKFPGGNLVDFL